MAENIISKLNVGGTEYDIVAASAKDTSAVAGIAATAVTASAAAGQAANNWITANTTGTSAKNAVNAGSAEKAAKLSTARNIAASGDVTWSVSFDGSQAKTGNATINSVPASAISAVPYSAITAYGKSSLTPNSASTTTGYASAAAVEKALATLQSEIGQIAAFDGPYTTSGSIPTPYKTNTIYLVGPAGVEPDSYQEYISTDGAALTMIGDTSIDMSQYQTTAGMTAYVQKADISAASAKWNGASAFAASASGNYSTISGYATDWNTNKTAVSGAATSGAAASAWISSHSANLDNTIAAVTGAVTTSAGMTAAANTGKLATVGAITGYVEEQLDETIDIAEEISDANSAKIPNVKAVKTYVDGHTQNAYGQIFVTNGSTTNSASAGKSNDAVEFIAGDNIKLTVGGTKNPSITISAKDTTYTSSDFITAGSATNISNAFTYATDWNTNKDDVIGAANSGAYASAYILDHQSEWTSDTKYSISGWNGVTASYTADGSTSALKVSGVQATSANVGVTKASYVNGETLYVF